MPRMFILPLEEPDLVLPEKVDSDLLAQQVSAEIARLEKNRDRDKGKAKRVTIFAASGSAGATMLLGLSKFTPALELWLQSGSIIVGTVTTIVLAWDKLFDHKKLWVIGAQTVRQLYRLKEQMEHTSANNGWSDEVAIQYYSEYCQILADGDTKWDQIRSRS